MKDRLIMTITSKNKMTRQNFIAFSRPQIYAQLFLEQRLSSLTTTIRVAVGGSVSIDGTRFTKWCVLKFLVK